MHPQIGDPTERFDYTTTITTEIPIGLEGVFVHGKLIVHVKYDHRTRIMDLYLLDSPEPHFSWKVHEIPDDPEQKIEKVQHLIITNLVELNHLQMIFLNKRYHTNEM